MKIFNIVKNAIKIIEELLIFLWKKKLWWMIPLIIILLIFGLFLIFVETTGIAPFIYTLF